MEIIVPIDFSDNSIKALEFAISLADKWKGKITLFHVIEIVYDFKYQVSIAMDSMFNDIEKLFIILTSHF